MPHRTVADDDFADEIRAIRRRSGRKNPLNAYILAGLVAGVACAIVGGLFWLAFRQPVESPERTRERELIQNWKEAQEQHRRDGTKSLGDAILSSGKELIEADRR